MQWSCNRCALGARQLDSGIFGQFKLHRDHGRHPAIEQPHAPAAQRVLIIGECAQTRVQHHQMRHLAANQRVQLAPVHQLDAAIDIFKNQHTAPRIIEITVAEHV